MNLLNQEIQAIEYQIAYYKKKKQHFEELCDHDTVRYYERKLEELEKELEIRLKESKD
jgi:predicted metal-dependent phosphoesterase TrpH